MTTAKGLMIVLLHEPFLGPVVIGTKRLA